MTLALVLVMALFGAKPDGAHRPDASHADTLARPVVIKRCDLFKGNGRSNEVVCTGNVQLVRDDANITCDRMTAHIINGDQVTHAVCDGHVVITQPDRWGKGEHADLNNVTGVLVVTGAPEMHQGKSVLHGEKVTFYVDTNEVFVSKATGQILKENLPAGRAHPDAGTPK